MMRKNIHVRVTPGELSARVLHFDRDGDGLVSCSEFLKEFKKMGREERRRKKKNEQKLTLEITQRNQDREVKTMNKLSESFASELVVGGNRSLARALDRIAEVAGTYDPAGPVNLLAAFQV
jgi:hypothetical protein